MMKRYSTSIRNNTGEVIEGITVLEKAAGGGMIKEGDGDEVENLI
jgi:hypothetical protein